MVGVETDRLILRPLVPTDAPALVRHANHFSISEFNPNIPFPYGRTQARAFIRMTQKEFAARSAFPFAIHLKRLDEVVGMMGFIKVDAAHNHAEIGYWISAAHRKQGFSKEGLRGLVAYGFGTLKLHRMWAKVLGPNMASQQLLRSCGFVEEGRMRQHVLLREERMDDILFAKLAHECGY